MEGTEMVCVFIGVAVLGDGEFLDYDAKCNQLCILFECFSVSDDAYFELSGELPLVRRSLSVVPELFGVSSAGLVGGIGLLGV